MLVEKNFIVWGKIFWDYQQRDLVCWWDLIFLAPFYAMNIFTLFSKVQCEDSLEILKLCDRYFEGDIPEYFFDR